MAVYRSAQGRQIDMATLVSQNEKVRAVGNKNVNARGDVIDSQNKIIMDVNRSVKNNYNKTVNKQETVVQIKPDQPKSEPVVEEMSKEELEFEHDDITEQELEQIKPVEKKNGNKKGI